MTKTALDEILEEFGYAIVNHPEASRASHIGTYKRAILQWVADEVVGKDEKLTGTLDKDGFYVDNNEQHLDTQKVLRNIWRKEQRQILKDHGWKPSDKEES